MTKKVYKISCY